jgi:CRISPR-associated protein Csa3
MANILIATIYSYEPIMAIATKISADRLIILSDKKPDNKQKKSIELIKQSLGSVLEIKRISIETYNIVQIAKETIKIIDLLSDKDQIYIDITAGRKTQALGLLFGAYARCDRIKKISYVTEEDKKVITLPKVSYNLTSAQKRIVEFISNNKIKSMTDFSEEVDVSRGMLYKHIKELKDMDIIEETPEGIKLTDYGKIVVM